MATVVKDFKIKSGLVVEGTNGSINGFDILTKKTEDQNYIIGLIGGSATPNATASTVVLRDENASFSANVVTADLVGNVTGNVTGELTGNADTATALESTLTIDLNGDASGFVEFDGSEGNVVMNVTLDSSFATDTDVATAKSEAIEAAASDATSKANAAQSAAESFATSADTTLYGTVTTDIATAKSEAQSFATSADTTLYGTVTGDIADAKQEAIDAAASDATTKANNAEANAESYADSLIGDNTVDGTPGNTVKDRIDSAVAGLVDGAPELLNTLNELAEAIGDNPDTISNLQNLAAGKQDALTAGYGIDIDGSSTISVTGLVAEDISDFDTQAVTANTGLWDTIGAAATAKSEAVSEAASDATSKANAAQAAAEATASADATSKANTAQSNAETYAQGLVDALSTDDIEEGSNEYFTTEKAKRDAAALLVAATKTNIEITGDENGLTITAENGVADSDTDDLAEGKTNLYFTDERAVTALQGTDSMFTTVDINELALQVAATLDAPTAGIQTAYAWAANDYRSAEFLVKVAYGSHTEISKVLLTLDTSDNIAITEYGIVGTNGSASSISAAVVDGNVELQVTTTNNNSDVTVVGTLLA